MDLLTHLNNPSDAQNTKEDMPVEFSPKRVRKGVALSTPGALASGSQERGSPHGSHPVLSGLELLGFPPPHLTLLSLLP